MKIYTVTREEHDFNDYDGSVTTHFRVESIFSTKELAEAFVKSQEVPGQYKIVIRTMDEDYE